MVAQPPPAEHRACLSSCGLSRLDCGSQQEQRSSDVPFRRSKCLLPQFFLSLIFQGQSDSGSSSASWTVPDTLAEGDYEIAVRTKCTPSVSNPLPGLCFYSLDSVTASGLDSSVSPSIRGIIDFVAPVKFGQGLQPSSKIHYIGDEISATFTEDIDCSRPHSFSVTILVETQTPKTLAGSD
jgi:hypothetical protein